MQNSCAIFTMIFHMEFCNSLTLLCFPITQLKHICLKHMSNLFIYLGVAQYGNLHQFSQLKNPHWSLHIKGLKTWSLGSSSLLAAEAHSKHSFTLEEANPLSKSKQGVLHFIQQNKHAQNSSRTHHNKIRNSNPRGLCSDFSWMHPDSENAELA